MKCYTNDVTVLCKNSIRLNLKVEFNTFYK